MAKLKKSIETKIRGEKTTSKTEGVFKEIINDIATCEKGSAEFCEGNDYPKTAIEGFSKLSAEKNTDYQRLVSGFGTALERMDSVVEVLKDNTSKLKKEANKRKENYYGLTNEVEDLKIDVEEMHNSFEKIAVFLKKVYDLDIDKDLSKFKKKVKKINK